MFVQFYRSLVVRYDHVTVVRLRHIRTSIDNLLCSSLWSLYKQHAAVLCSAFTKTSVVHMNWEGLRITYRVSRHNFRANKMTTKWQAQGLVGFLLILVILAMSVPSAWATSNDTPGFGGPSLEETLAFIKDTWEACATMQSGLQRVIAKDGSLWQLDRMAKVDAVVMPPSTLRIITRLNERRKLSGVFEIQSPAETIQEFDMSTLSPHVSPERDGENIFGIRLRCARGACVTEWFSSLAIPGKSMHELKTGKVVVTSLDELVYEDRAPKDKPAEKKGEMYIPVCDQASLESLSKAFHHAIIKAGGKKPLF